MKIRNGLVLVMAIGRGATGSASGGGGGGGSPRNTDNTRAAEDHLDAAEDSESPDEARTHYEMAASAADLAIAEDPENPLAYRLAAMAERIFQLLMIVIQN